MDVIDVQVVATREETPWDRSLVLELPPAARADFPHRPGQAVSLLDPAEEEPRPRWFSLSLPPGADGRFEVTIRRIVDTQPHWPVDPEGRTLSCSKPTGSFVLERDPGEDLLLLAGGSGITPFRSFIGALRSDVPDGQVTLVHSSREPGHLIFRAEFEEAEAANPWLRYIPTITGEGSPEWTGRRGRIDRALLAGLVPRAKETAVYACGPGPFVESMLQIAGGLGVAETHLRREQW